MSFKIVKTFEKGRAELCVVPCQWESDGELKWPKKGAEKLSKERTSIPGSDWLTIKCSVKRKNIVSYEVADAELRAMLDNTDTEKEDEQVTSRRPLQRQGPINLNDLAEQLVVQENFDNLSTSASNYQSEAAYIILPDDARNEAPTLEPNADLQNILQNQAVLFQMATEIIDTQKCIVNKLASLSVQMEESFSRIEKVKSVCDTVTLKDAASRAENDSFILKQMKNVQELEEMEKLLSDNVYKMKVKRSCSFVCSGGIGTGTNCAYRMLDILFSRDFLCHCSWSGGSRDDGIKVSLKCFKNTLNFFFELINHWDSSYTYEANEVFFKNILKNAKKRNSVKYERIPTKRHRTGNKSAKKQKTNNASNENIENLVPEMLCVPIIPDQPANDTTEGAKNKEGVLDFENVEEQEESLC